jgi:hypothetical protein
MSAFRILGNAAGGLSQGLYTGQRINDMKQDMEFKKDAMEQARTQRERDTKFFRNLAALQTGAISPQDFYKQMSADMGFAPMAAQGGMPEQLAGPGMPGNPAEPEQLAGPGLATVR